MCLYPVLSRMLRLWIELNAYLKTLYALKQAHVPPPNTIKHDGEKMIGLAKRPSIAKRIGQNPIENHRSEIYKKRYKDLKLRIASIAEDIGLSHECLRQKK